MKVRATLKRRGGGISGTWIGSRSKWRQVNVYKDTDLSVQIESLREEGVDTDKGTYVSLGIGW